MSLEELESELKEIITKIKEEEVPMVEVKKVLMVHNDKNQRNLSVAHNRCEKSFINKSWKHMQSESSGFATGPKNKVFVKEAGTREKGKDSTGASYCFQFNLDLFDESFKAELIQMFKPPHSSLKLNQQSQYSHKIFLK